MASTPNYCDVTPEIEALAAMSLENSCIDPEDYVRYDVKRGLRDLNGKGVVAGLTEISDIVAKKLVDGKEIPCDGKLYYRGVDVEELVSGALREGRFGYLDCGGARLTGEGKLECVGTVRAGEVIYDPEARSAPEWQEAPAPYWTAPGLMRSWELRKEKEETVCG